MIVVDPVRTPTARDADLHLQPFPGSDAALAFALLGTIHREGLCDRDLIERCTTGFDELEPMLAGLHRELGRTRHGRAGTADRRGGEDVRERARRCCGSARASSASRGAATPCGRSRCCRP